MRQLELPHTAGVIAVETLRHARLPNTQALQLAELAERTFRQPAAPGWRVQAHLALASIIGPHDASEAAARLISELQRTRDVCSRPRTSPCARWSRNAPASTP